MTFASERPKSGQERMPVHITNLYIDLDGTLLDVSERYWRLHSDLVHKHALPAACWRRFWAGKRRREPIGQLLGVNEALQQAYWNDWLESIETPQFVASDRLVHGAIETLAGLRETYRLGLVTMRKDRRLLDAQLRSLGLREFFNVVLASEGEGVSKAEMVASDLRGGSGAMIVGDTEVDLEAGHLLGMPAVGITSGLRDADHLAAESPEFLLNSIRGLPSVFVRLTEGGESGRQLDHAA
jgi:phosphoglycolate phosphatase